MSLYAVSIRRPVLAIVMSLTIIILGLISFSFLPVREYPSVDPPVVTVQTPYAGASADVIDTRITQPLEASINAVEGITKLTSISQQGLSRITVEFDLNTEMERAANDVRDRVGAAVNRLPVDADPPRVTKSSADASPLVLLNISSGERSMLELSEIAAVTFAERLQTIAGTASIEVIGEKRFAMRIWLNPHRLAAYGLTPLDVQQALRAQNIELPSGSIEGNTTELTVRTVARMSEPSEFENLILRQDGSTIVRLRDVAEVVLGAQNEQSTLNRDGIPMIGLFLRPQPGANHISMVDEFYKRIKTIQHDVPSDVKVATGYDNTLPVRASIKEVRETIFIAVVLVILIIFLFLRDWRTTIIPVLAIPVSLIGAFFVMYVARFSINVLTLLSIVLAVGLVVDDAIVVLENIYRKTEEGLDAVEAGIEGTREIVFAVLATTAALVAVFLPILFLSGIAGRLFREFGIVLAAAVLISAFASLTLTPMLAVKVLKRRAEHPWFYRKTEPFFRRMIGNYDVSLQSFLRHRWIAFACSVGAAALSVGLWKSLPSELAPLEDRSLFRIRVQAPVGSSFDYMSAYMDKLRRVIFENTPEALAVLHVTPDIGAALANGGVVLVVLRQPKDRVATQQQIVDRAIKLAASVPGARAFSQQPATISVGAAASGLPVQYVLLAPSSERLEAVLPRFLKAAQDDPAFTYVDANLKFDRPELDVEIDRARAQSLGISARDISQTIQLALSGLRYEYFIRNGRQYDVIGQVARQNRSQPLDLNALYVRSRSGEPVPLGNLVRYKERVGPPQIFRFNRYLSATIAAQLATGYSIADGIRAMDKVANATLDSSFTTALDGQSREFKEGSHTLLFVFSLALVLIYLVLSAQFDSFRDPLTIMLSVPLALSGALVSLWYFNQTLNIFSQIGMIMLIGLVTKHGILIVEFANQRKALGLSTFDAVREASAARFRPIMMTASATVLGVLPIALAFGAGSESRMPMGIAVVGGMVVGTFFSLYLVPAMYIILAPRTRRPAPPAAVRRAAAETPEREERLVLTATPEEFEK